MKNLPLFIALRYLRSPKSHSVINLISWVALVAIAIPTAALVVILSLHNGLSDTIEKLYSSFDPQIKITPATGKYFDPQTLNLTADHNIKAISFTVEDNVLLRNGEREYLATIKGVDDSFGEIVQIQELITHGKYELQRGDLNQAIVGQGVAYNLGVNPSLVRNIDVYAMLPDRSNSIFQSPIYRSAPIMPIGVYALDQENDSRYIITPLLFAQQILGADGKVSAAEIMVAQGADPESVKEEIVAKIGSQFKVETRYEQKATLYRSINQEKWIIYLLLMMVLLIASLSLAGSIMILITDKRNQIQTLRTMGATTSLIRSVFRSQGVIIVAVGVVVGVVLGSGFALGQQYFGFIAMPGESSLVSAYPVRVSVGDIVVISIGILIIGQLLSYVTTKVAIR